MNTMQAKVKVGYNQAAQAYQAGRDQFKSDPYLEKFQEFLQPNSKILDIGCGSGRPVDSFLVENGHTVIGIDISEEQIKLARQNVPGATYDVCNMSELRDNEYSVDAVVSFYAIFHIPREEHSQLLRKINSFLSPGGLLLVTMGSSDWQGNEEFFGVNMHWSHYDSEKNMTLVQEAGFAIVLDEIDTTGGEKHQVILAQKSE